MHCQKTLHFLSQSKTKNQNLTWFVAFFFSFFFTVDCFLFKWAFRIHVLIQSDVTVTLTCTYLCCKFPRCYNSLGVTTMLSCIVHVVGFQGTTTVWCDSCVKPLFPCYKFARDWDSLVLMVMLTSVYPCCRFPGYYHSLVDILVATPGRLVDHINSTPGFDLSHMRFLVCWSWSLC